MGPRIDLNDPRHRLLINGVSSLFLTMAGYGSAWLGYFAYAPSLNKIVWGAFSLALFAYWIAILIVAAIRAKSGAPLGWKKARQSLEFGTFLGVNGVTWLFMPFGTTALQHVTLLFSTSYCAATILSSADENAFTRTRIAIVMGGLAAVCVIYQVELWPYLTIYLVTLGAVLTIFDQLIRTVIGELRIARREAEEAVDVRTRFLQAAAHDLGQPLQASRLFHEQAVRSANQQDRECANQAARNAFSAMERLLHAILDHLRLSEGTYVSKLESVSSDRLLRGIVLQYSAAARLQGIDLAVLPGNLIFEVDKHLCERVLSNLVDNALRHAQAGRVRIGARRSAAHGVRLFVADDGIGITADDAPSLFEDYKQGASHGEGGFGLGLGSATRAAVLMGGHIGCEARWRSGAQFYLELPMRA